MRLGVQIVDFNPGPHGNAMDTVLATARACEEAGVETVWFPDHFMLFRGQPPRADEPVVECFTALAAIAATTQRVRLGAWVAAVPYRNPALLAKMSANLDVLSHGRTIVGIGAGWHEAEFRAYGYEFGPVRERMDRLEEAAHIVRSLLEGGPLTFEGRYYSVHEAVNYPLPVQRPRPPLLIGGGGERRTLAIVARYADVCNVGGDLETVGRKFEVLRRHCERIGRPFEEIELTSSASVLLGRDERELARKRERFPRFGGIIGTPEQVAERLRAYSRIGAEHLVVTMPDAADLEPVHTLMETIPPLLA